jgi:hypothetical protein
LVLVGVLIALTISSVAALALWHPPVSASIETRVPPAAGIPVALFGAVTSSPVTARKLGTLRLDWLPSGRADVSSTERESTVIEVPVSPRDCARLSQIGGGCETAGGTPLHGLEWVRVEALGGSLFADALVGTTSRIQLEQGDEPTERGAPVEWTLTESAEATRIELSCGAAVRFSIGAAPNRRGPRIPARTAVCRPTGVRYRLAVRDYSPTATTIGFSRLGEFEAAAIGNRGRVDVDRGTLVMDGSSREIGDEDPIPVALHPEDGSRLSLRIDSPQADAPTKVRLQSGEANEVLVDREDVVPSELCRLPNLLIASVLIPWTLFLVRQAWRSLKTLAKERSGNGEKA